VGRGGVERSRRGGEVRGICVACHVRGACAVDGERPTDFPVTPGAFETTHNAITLGDDDVFVTKLNRAGSALVYSTYLGGSSDDFVQPARRPPSV
jgi:hypothetical protein